MTIDMKQLRAQAEAAQKDMEPTQVKEQERNLLLGVLDAWPELVQGICAGVNELLKEQVVIAQTLDPTPLKVKAVRPDTLRASVEEKGMDAVVEVIERVEAGMREINRRAKALRAERDRLQAAGGAPRGPTE